MTDRIEVLRQAVDDARASYDECDAKRKAAADALREALGELHTAQLEEAGIVQGVTICEVKRPYYNTLRRSVVKVGTQHGGIICVPVTKANTIHKGHGHFGISSVDQLTKTDAVLVEGGNA